MAYRVTGMHFFHDNHVNINDALPEDLTSKKRYTEAGYVLLDYAEDDRESCHRPRPGKSVLGSASYRELSWPSSLVVLQRGPSDSPA